MTIQFLHFRINYKWNYPGSICAPPPIIYFTITLESTVSRTITLNYVARHAMPQFLLRECFLHYDVIKWKQFPRYWSFVRGIHRLPVNSPHKGQWRVALMISLFCAWINGWVNNGEAGDSRRHRAHYDVVVMKNICVWAQERGIRESWQWIFFV